MNSAEHKTLAYPAAVCSSASPGGTCQCVGSSSARAGANGATVPGHPMSTAASTTGSGQRHPARPIARDVWPELWRLAPPSKAAATAVLIDFLLAQHKPKARPRLSANGRGSTAAPFDCRRTLAPGEGARLQRKLLWFEEATAVAEICAVEPPPQLDARSKSAKLRRRWQKAPSPRSPAVAKGVPWL